MSCVTARSSCESKLKRGFEELPQTFVLDYENLLSPDCAQEVRTLIDMGRKNREALQKPLFPSRIEQNCSVRFFFTTSKNGVFLPLK